MEFSAEEIRKAVEAGANLAMNGEQVVVAKGTSKASKYSHFHNVTCHPFLLRALKLDRKVPQALS